MIDLTDTVTDAICKMAQGNPGAAVACTNILRDPERGMITLLRLDELNIRGSALWCAYKDYADHDVPKLIQAVQDKAPELFKAIRVRCPEYQEP